MTRKFRKYGQVERTLIHLQNAPVYYAKYKNDESEVKVLIELISEKAVAEERKVNMRRTVTLEHFFGNEKTQETTRRRKNQDGSTKELQKKQVIPKTATVEGCIHSENIR